MSLQGNIAVERAMKELEQFADKKLVEGKTDKEVLSLVFAKIFEIKKAAESGYY